MYRSLFLIISTAYCLHRLNKTITNEDYISKDISDINVTVHMEEFEDIPTEPNKENGRIEICKNSLLHNYENDVYALSEHYGCDIMAIASPVDKYPTILKDTQTSFNSVKNHDLTPEKLGLCNKSKIAARCSSYLRFANCIFLNYKSSSKLISIDEQIKSDINNTFIDKYILSGSGRVGFLLNEALGHFCRFVHSACASIHPQFDLDYDYFKTQACIIFDLITPLYNSYRIFRSKHEMLSTFYKYDNQDMIQSQIYVPLEKPTNTAQMLIGYKDSLCNNRCNLANELYVSFMNNN